jgi:hypothetical protein
LIELLRTPSNINITFEQSPLIFENCFDILGVKITNTLSWRSHLLSLVSSAAKKLGALFRVAHYFTSSQLSKIYKGNIRPNLEYCSHIWGGSSSVWILERVDRRARRLINSPALLAELLPLQQRRKVTALSIFYRLYNGGCSDELRSLLPPAALRRRPTRAAAQLHPLALEPPQCRIERFKQSFIPSATAAWNELPSEVFPPIYNIKVFKSRVNTFLSAQRVD